MINIMQYKGFSGTKAIREAQSKGVSTEQLEEQVNMAI